MGRGGLKRKRTVAEIDNKSVVLENVNGHNYSALPNCSQSIPPSNLHDQHDKNKASHACGWHASPARIINPAHLRLP